MKKSASGRRSACPINIALEIFGDRWSLLIVRDLMFKGLRTFKEFAESEEGIATNILTDRLQWLEAHGILTSAPDPSDRRKVVYQLTTKGVDLAPVLVEMVLWSDNYEQTAAPPEIIAEMRANRARFLAKLRKAHSEVGKIL